MKFRTVLSLCTLSLAAACCSAQDPTYYQFHPMSIMSLGLGFSVADLTEPKQPCVVFDRAPLDPGSLDTRASIQMVSDSESLRRALSMDANIDVSYLMFKGSTHFSYSEQNLFSSTDISFVLKYQTEYGRIGIKNQHLSPRAQGLLDSHDLATFKKECGNRMVLIEHRGATVEAIVTLHGEDASTRAQFSGSLSGGMDLGALSGSLKASLSGEMDRAVRDKRISVQVVSTGGDGFEALSSLVEQDLSGQDAFSNIQKALSGYLKSFNKDNAAPIGFAVGPMYGMAEAENDLWSFEKERRLADIVDEYRADDSHLVAIRAILSGSDLRSSVYSESEIAQLKQIEDPLDSYMATLASVHAACKTATISSLSSCRLPKGKPTVPKFLQPVSAPFGNWFVVVDGTPWTALRSRTVFEDPGGGTLMERVRHRVPNAKSATVVFAIKGRIVDAQLFVGNSYPVSGYPLGVLYPNNTFGGRAVPAADQMSLTVDYDGHPDVNLVRIAWARANYMHCLPLIPTGNAFRVFVKARDEFGQLQSFELGTAFWDSRNYLNVWPPTKEAQYRMPLDSQCQDVPFYLQSSSDGLFKQAIKSVAIVPFPEDANPAFYSDIERQVRAGAPAQ